MSKLWWGRFSSLLLPAVLLSVPRPLPAAPAGVELLTASESGVSFILRAPDAPLRVVERPGQPPSLEIDGLASIEAANGWQMPARTVWVAVPPEARVSGGGRALDEEPLRIDRPGRIEVRFEGLGSQSVEIAPPTWLRNQRVVAVTWTPVIPSSQGPIRQHAVQIDLHFRLEAPAVRSVPAADGWEGVYEHLLVNYESARSWRRVRYERKGRPDGDYFSTTSNPWLRIDVDRHGLYEVRGTDLQAAGIDLSAVEPARLGLFTGSGLSLPEDVPVTELPEWLHEVAIDVADEDGVFDPQDRILFRGLGPDGWFSDYGQPDALFERFRTDEFSNTNTYWLSWGAFEGTRRRWEIVDGGDVPQNPSTTALHRVHFEKNRFWDPKPWETLTGTDLQLPDSLPFWEKWHWDEILATRSGSRSAFRFRIPTPDPSGTASILTRMWGASFISGSAVPDHYITADLDGEVIAEGAWDDYDHLDLVATGLSLSAEDQELGLRAPFGDDTTGFRIDRSYLAFFEVDYRRRLVFVDDSLAFRVQAGSNREGFSVSGIADPASVVILDVTDPLQVDRIIPRVEPDGSDYRYLFGIDPDPNREKQILLVSSSSALQPSIIRDEQPGAGYLRERTDPVDYILITHSLAYDAAERLAAWRELHGPDQQGLRVAVVDVQDVFDEFSAGRVDPVAIRNFLHHASLYWNGGNPADGPSYVCILGDASFDFRNHRGQRGDLIVPTYEGYYVGSLVRTIYSPQFGSDDFMVLFDGVSDPALDMAIGRLPADNPASAEALVDKIISYESPTTRLDNWRQHFTLVADDICQGLDYDDLYFRHMSQTELLADELLPAELVRDRIYLYEFGNECVFDRKPDAAAALRASIDRGTLFINYTGHGSEEQLADERVLETPGVAGMTNADRLFFFLTASCSVGKFDFAGEGLAEALVRQPDGGAIGVFSATGVAYSGPNAQLNREFFAAVFPDRDVLQSVPFGPAAVIAKQSVSRPGHVGNRRYPLLGAPAVRIATPRLRAAVELEGRRPDGGSSVDTIYRGAPVRIAGEIQDQLGNRLTAFQGRAALLLYDSEILRQEAIFTSSAEYNLNGAPIFRGEVPVVDGTFETDLIAPAALRSGERGDALLYVLALSDQDEATAIGSRTGIYVPTVPPPASSDQEGPVIELRVDGDLERLPAGAAWEATLVDTSGINITQLVPSRSVLLKIEEGTRLVHLEDLAPQVYFPEGYQTGRLDFRLPDELETGQRYLLTLEASDNRDHRASASMEFRLAGSGSDELALGRVYNVPNPMDRATTFFLEIGRPAEVTIRIFTANGKRVRELRPGIVSPTEAAGIGIDFDGDDEDGERLANGVYFYKVTVQGEDGQRASRIERLAVLR